MLAVTGQAPSFKEALTRAYAGVAKISFDPPGVAVGAWAKRRPEENPGIRVPKRRIHAQYENWLGFPAEPISHARVVGATIFALTKKKAAGLGVFGSLECQFFRHDMFGYPKRTDTMARVCCLNLRDANFVRAADGQTPSLVTQMVNAWNGWVQILSLGLQL